jgi:hypothetical protein
MGGITGIHDIRAIRTISECPPGFAPSFQEIGKHLIPVAGYSFPVDGNSQDLMVVESVPPTLLWLTANIGDTLVSNLKKGDDTL